MLNTNELNDTVRAGVLSAQLGAEKVIGHLSKDDRLAARTFIAVDVLVYRLIEINDEQRESFIEEILRVVEERMRNFNDYLDDRS